MSEVKVSAVVWVAEREGFEFHAFGHLHDGDFGVNDADWLDLHLLDFIAVLAVLAIAFYSAFQSCGEAGTILLVAFCLLAGTVGPVLIFLLARALFSQSLGLDALLAAEIVHTVVNSFVAGTCLSIALEIAEANMIDFGSLLVWKPLGLLVGRFHGSLERVEMLALWVGFAVICRRGGFCK